MKTLFIASVLFSLNTFGSTFIVEMKKPLSAAEISLANAKGLKIELFDRTQTAYFKRTYHIEAANGAAISSQLPVATLESVHEAQILSLEPSSKPQFLRPDRLFHLQWGLNNEGQRITKLINNTKQISVEGRVGSDIRWASAIKKIEVGMKYEPIVAVIDMGVDLDHPEIKNRLFRNTAECNDKGEIGDADADKDNNGLKGDCMGWNFAGRNMYEARRPYDDTGHGTHVAGIIAAESNAEGVTGVSSKIRILPVKVTGIIDESSDRKMVQPLTDRIAKGILYATNMGADVINLSLGWTRSMDTKYLNEAISYALSKNVVIVAAAGNNNNNATIFPCAHYDVICVGAASIDGSLAEFSNYGGEVDVLAPGEEIISIIPTQIVPLQLNLQGYDIRSGTSQAAPFVSAAAALLRGNFPGLPVDEVTRRIVDSADAGIPGKSLSGMLNLKGAFEIAQASSVRPIFKNMSVALYDGPTNRFMYPLNVKNFGAEVKDVVIKISSKSESFKSIQEYTVPLIRQGEIITLRFEGEIVDVMAHNQVQFEVSVTTSAGTKAFEHEFRMTRDILKDKNITNVPFEFLADALPVGTIKDGLTKNLINTVETLSPEVGIPEYYLPRLVKETNSMDLKIIRPYSGKLKEVAGVISLIGATQLLNVTRMDLNFDGVDDYLIRAVACEKNCEDPAKASRYIQYSLWNKDLSPMFGNKSVWKFLPIMFNVDIKSQKFLRLKTKDFGDIAVPAFLETGVIPMEQQVIAPFSKPDSSSARRMYHLEPSVNEEGKVELLTRTKMTAAFTEKVRETVKAHVSEEIQTLHLLNQTKEELKVGQVTALVSVGKGYLRKNYTVTLGTDEEVLKNYSITQNLWGYEQLKSQDLETQDLADSFTGLVSRSRLVMFQTSVNKSYSYSSHDSVEAPLGTIASFKDHDNEYTFFQTPSYLVLAHNTVGGTDFSQMKINRFSFLPGTLFNDTFYPVLNRTAGKFSPALYVDETDIQSNVVSFTVFTDGKLKSPISQSSFIPPICKALNPVRLESEEGHSLTLLCYESKRWVMKFVHFN